MELEGAKRYFTYLQISNVSIGTFITDRHLSITAWMRVSQPNTRHRRGSTKAMRFFLNGSKVYQSSLLVCNVYQGWIWRTHFGQVKILINHVANKHTNHEDSLFKKCAHEPLTERRQWIKIGVVILF